MDTSVKYFDNTMAGAPALINFPGARVAALDACRVNGFGAVTLDSLVVAGGIATGTVDAGHGFAMTGLTGPVIAIAGASPPELNGEWRLSAVPTATRFHFAAPGIADQTAAGDPAIAAKRAPAGWEKLYSGVYKAVYRRADPSATAMVLRVDDNGVTYPELCMYESMSDIDTGTGASAVAYTMRAAAAGNAWRLAADGHALWFWTNAASTFWTFSGFGDLAPVYIPADAYACVLRGFNAANAGVYGTFAAQLGGSAALQLARAETQISAALTANAYASGPGSPSFGNKSQPWPAADGRIHTHPVEVWSNSAARGLYPGLLDLVHASPGAYDGDTIETDGGRTLRIQKPGSNLSYGLAIDLTGPWR